MTLLISSHNSKESIQLLSAIKDSLQNEQTVLIRLGGYSMWPFIKPGTEATIIKADINSLEIGDIVVFSKSKKLIAHRVIRFKKDINDIITKGDNEFLCDGKINLDSFYGKIIMLKTSTKTVRLDSSFYKKLSFFMAKMSYIFTPIYRLIFKISYF